MRPNQEYLDNIAKKLDAFNQIDGFEPQQRHSFGDGFDFMDHMGKTAIDYMRRKKEESKQDPPQHDPLFGNHNT